MTDNLNNNRIQVQPIGKVVNIENNDIARLMYYLYCVNTVISHENSDRLTDYGHYYRLNKEEEELLLKLVVAFNPKLFIDAGIFIVDQNLLPYNMDNEFYQITDERIGIHINEELVIGGKNVKVLKIMACNSSWLNRNYINPIENINNRARYNNQPPPPLPRSPPKYNNNNDNDNDNDNDNEYNEIMNRNSNNCKRILRGICGIIIFIGLIIRIMNLEK